MIKSLQKEIVRFSFSAKAVKLIWGLIVPCIVFLVLFNELFNAAEHSSLELFPLNEIIWLVCALFLLPVNVYLEALKWQRIVRKTTVIPLVKSLKIVLSGKSLNMISPFGMGDAMVKYMNVQVSERSQSFGLIALDRMANMVPTLFFGLIATFFLIHQGLDYLTDLMYLVLGIGVLMIVGLLVFSKRMKRLVKEYQMYARAMAALTWRDTLTVVGIASFRYVVFSVQFYFVMRWLGVGLDIWILMLGIFWIFFIKTILPDITVFGDLMKRELSAVTFFALFLPSMELIILANFWIWLINIIIPSFVGLFFIADLKSKAV